MNAAVIPTTGLASQAGHWYTESGAPAYEVPAKKNGAMRAVTLRDARVMNLFPSVTTVLQVIAKPGLERWKVEQAILSSLTLGRLDGEDETAFAARALEDSKQQAIRAAERGTLLHEQIERSFRGAADPEWLAYVNPVHAALEAEFGALTWEPERSFACEAGYGGKVDLHSRERPVVVDFKSKDLPADRFAEVRAYPEHAIQLAAYARGLFTNEVEAPVLVNVFVNLREPGQVKLVRWPTDAYAKHLKMFLAALAFWQAERDYAPRWGSA